MELERTGSTKECRTQCHSREIRYTSPDGRREGRKEGLAAEGTRETTRRCLLLLLLLLLHEAIPARCAAFHYLNDALARGSKVNSDRICTRGGRSTRRQIASFLSRYIHQCDVLSVGIDIFAWSDRRNFLCGNASPKLLVTRLPRSIPGTCPLHAGRRLLFDKFKLIMMRLGGRAGYPHK